MPTTFAYLPRNTRSVCPVCLSAIPATIEAAGEDVALHKECPQHGRFSTVIWRGAPGLEAWRRPKPAAPTLLPFAGTGKGCPHDCGLCAQHRQRSCTVLFEITPRCNLHCPVCFANAGNEPELDPPLSSLEILLRRAAAKAGPVIAQLSGGEPTMRDDLPAIIGLALSAGFSHVQLNTNGLRLASEPGYAAVLKAAGLSWIFLQFDGLREDTWRALRGRPLLEEKVRALEHAAAAGLGVVLVPTLVPGINTDEVGDILRFAMDRLPAVRGVHFQPVSSFGRFPHSPKAPRLTLPELLRDIEGQTSGLLRAEGFGPPGCEHERCSFHGHFLRREDGTVQALRPAQPCCGPQSDNDCGAGRTPSVVARQWSAVPGAASCCGNEHQGLKPPPGSLDAFLVLARQRTFSVTAMAFQDAWTMDLERLQGCCVHVAAPDGRLVPFCAWNLTAADGTALHRGRPGNTV